VSLDASTGSASALVQAAPSQTFPPPCLSLPLLSCFALHAKPCQAMPSQAMQASDSDSHKNEAETLRQAKPDRERGRGSKGRPYIKIAMQPPT
jgi:hypothetical protein